MSTVSLHHVSAGSAEPPLVLLHGFTGSSVDWKPVLSSLASKRRVIAFDHRGHGQSPNLGAVEHYSFDLLLADFVAAVDALGLSRFHLLGHSMGGVISQRFALEHPSRLLSLVLMDTGPDPAGVLPMEMIEGLAAVGRAQGMAAAYEMIAAATGGATEDGREKFLGLDPEALVALGRELNVYPSMTAQLHTITVPTTVLVGANDTGLLEAATTMAREIPGSTHVVIPDAGHSPQEDQPELWLGAVEAHLERAAG